ncbi:MAG: type II secretion system protein GspM [Bryobacteraceae bacterium]
MTVTDRERRSLSFLGVSVLLSLIYWLATSGSSSSAAKVVTPIDSVDHAEKVLTTLRKEAATVPGKEAVLKQVSSELNDREKGLIKGDTAAQAQAQLVQILREVAKNQSPPLEIRGVELGPVKPFGEAYGEVSVSLTLDCRIDQLVNYLAFLSAQPELFSTDEVRITASNPKLKNMPVRLTVSGLLPRKLVPVKKGFAS